VRPTVLLIAALVALPSGAQGQSASKAAVPVLQAPRDPLPRFTIAPRGGSLAAVGLPLPPHGLQPPAVPIVPGGHHRPVWAPYWYWPMVGFWVPPVAYEPAPAPQPVAPEPVQQAPGRLFLDVYPGGAQIFADGYYVGVAEDFGLPRGGGLIDAGTHRIDVTAAGYEAVAVDLKVTAGQFLTYRATLRALPPPATVPPSTFYLIPGCYMGNIPPKDAHLPATCDPSRATTWKP
jgi:hypothetical protein